MLPLGEVAPHSTCQLHGGLHGSSKVHLLIQGAGLCNMGVSGPGPDMGPGHCAGAIASPMQRRDASRGSEFGSSRC